MLVSVYAVVALLASVYALWSRNEFRHMSSEDRWAASAVIAAAAWPTVCTFLLGPLLVGSPASPLFPTMWYLPAAVLALGILSRNLNAPRPLVDLPTALLLVVSLGAGITLITQGATTGELFRWGLAGVLLTIPLLKRERVTIEAVGYGCRVSIAVIALAIVATTLVDPSAVAGCRTDKCGSAGAALTSAFAGNGNVLGLTVALLLPFAFVRRGVAQCGALVIAVLALGELAGSRTAFIGVGVAVVMTVLLRAGRAGVRRSVLAVGLVATLALSLAPAVLQYSDSSFTFRGSLWNQAKRMIAENLFLGSGPVSWEKYGASAVYDANYSPHSGWLDVTLSVGVVGAVLIVVALGLKVLLASHAEADVLVVFLCSLLGISTLESLYVPYFLGITPFAAILPLMVGPGRRPAPGASRANSSARSVRRRIFARSEET